ncbi:MULTISPECIES: recombinase family protein [unclassified Ruminococcus]|uniref:recombinase family protein n=1 Tax=unclassified Ruminococcus TaxID=2608920 RepID=UPI00210959B2|nr:MULTISPECIES: recombinase family protein [unclassified Ruminococcus]MCQ4022511.1 integrase [Ruminococcus sp. zg-924]MCQ4115146.1 integrase [Ruminococcus sp. zg-921]
MGHIPLGYRIEKGIAVVDEPTATKIRQLYKNYLSGLSLINAAKKAGIQVSHSGVKHIIQNEHYLGDDFYPAIIDIETFRSASDEIKRRSAKLGRDNRYKAPPEKKVPLLFHIGDIEKYFDNPIKQAEYLYNLIESEAI